MSTVETETKASVSDIPAKPLIPPAETQEPGGNGSGGNGAGDSGDSVAQGNTIGHDAGGAGIAGAGVARGAESPVATTDAASDTAPDAASTPAPTAPPTPTFDPRGTVRSGAGTRILRGLDMGVTLLAGFLFRVIQIFNRQRPAPTFTPQWSDKPLLKSWERSKPKLGWPRETDSLCPQCVIDARESILRGETDQSVLIEQKVGEIKARIIERDGQVWMVKDCPEHGHFEDLISIDAAFHARLEALFPGRDIRSHNDEDLRCHGSSTLKYGRGAVLTVDLTNRCNMMCDPCFMDANQVGFVHELSWEETKQILDNALRVKPRRQMSVQFSGGEPTLSPHFLSAVRYCRELGYNSVQAATNGINFARSKEFCQEAADAGLRFVYLQFDGIGNAANSHRHVGNLFDVKLKAIDNLYEAGVQIVLVTTLINTVNNDQVGPIIRFAIENPKKIAFIAFQPVSFAGRDEAVSEERRLRQRYTLAHMAHDTKEQLGTTEPMRDWFPISAFSSFIDFADLVHGAGAEWGQTNCCSHPDCGVGTALMINKLTGEFAPVPEFLDIPGLLADTTAIADAGRGKQLSNFMMGLSLLRHYKPYKAPPSLTLRAILQKFDKTFGLTGKDYGSLDPKDTWKRRQDPWNFLFVAGMWFQDLFNYDFRRTEQCVIPYGTQEGEISFCAFNTGHGWRNIIEHKHQTSSVAEWFAEHGKHEVFGANKDVPLPDEPHGLVVNQADADRGRELDPDVAHTAREEQVMARRLARETRQPAEVEQPARAGAGELDA